MTSYDWLSIVSLVGALVLVTSGLRARRIEMRKGLLMAAAWAAIFFVVSAIVAGAQG